MGIKCFKGDTTDLATLEAEILTWQDGNSQVTVISHQQSQDGTEIIISILYSGEANP